MSQPGNELAELLWDNGPAFRAAPHHFPPFTCSADGSTATAQELLHKRAASVSMRDLGLPLHGGGAAGDDDAVPWLHYPIIDAEDDGGAAPLAPDYCSALLSGGYSNLPAAVASRDAGEPSSSNGGGVLVPTTPAPPPPEPAPKQLCPSGGGGVMNFSFFSRPLQRPHPHPQGGERSSSAAAAAAATASSPVDSTVAHTATNRLRSTPLFSDQRMAWLQPPKVSGSRTTVAAPPPPPPPAPNRQQETATTVTQRVSSQPRAPEPAVATAVTTSSVCSGNGDRAQLKRASHHPPSEWSLSQDEDLDDEPGELRRSSAGRSTKRSRTAEVHNLSERRRRDRINEKMRALQELIPNCNKIDKASMLEEAIEYLKTLQLQVQMMSMGTGLCVPPMLLPAAAMQHLQMPPMAAHFPHLAAAAMGMGFGMGAFDMGMGFPRFAGAQFPCPTMPVPPAAPMFGVPAAAHAHAMPSPPAPAATSGHTANNAAAKADQTPPREAGARDAGDSSHGDRQQQQQQRKNT